MRRSTQIDWQIKVQEAIHRILSDIDTHQSLKTLSYVLESSPYHFHRMFKALTGESVSECIKRLRLERAGYLLIHTEKKIIDIALDSGFKTPDF